MDRSVSGSMANRNQGLAATEARAVLVQRRKVLDDLNTIAAYARA